MAFLLQLQLNLAQKKSLNGQVILTSFSLSHFYVLWDIVLLLTSYPTYFSFRALVSDLDPPIACILPTLRPSRPL